MGYSVSDHFREQFSSTKLLNLLAGNNVSQEPSHTKVKIIIDRAFAWYMVASLKREEQVRASH